MNYISICSIFKNESHYLEEWLNYHILVGIQHFYLYNNDSEDIEKSQKIINKFSDKITLNHINGTNRQYDVYNHCINTYKNNRWIAMIDLDEFLVPNEADIKSLLCRYEYFPGLGINWLMFGSNGHENVIDNNYSVINRFTRCSIVEEKEDYSLSSTIFNANSHIKSIVDPNRTINFSNPHFAKYKNSELACDENYNIISGQHFHLGYAGTRFVSHNYFQLNHYFMKSWEEFYKRKSYPTPDTNVILDVYKKENIRNTFEENNRIGKYKDFHYNPKGGFNMCENYKILNVLNEL